MTKTEQLNRCATTPEERILLARILDKVDMAQLRGVPSTTHFLSPSEQAAVTRLLNSCGHPRHHFFGGYDGAERRICAFFPDWLEVEDWLQDEEGCPLSAITAKFPRDSGNLSHRDLLGSLMGLGLTREKLGDIIMDESHCQLILLKDVAPIVLSQWESAGRWKLFLSPIPLSQLNPKPPEVKTIRDTVATLRLDGVLSSAFSLSRTKAAALVSAGRVSVNHLECVKGDKQVAQGDIITARGLGKCMVREVLGQSKKGRIMIVLERYI